MVRALRWAAQGTAIVVLAAFVLTGCGGGGETTTTTSVPASTQPPAGGGAATATTAAPTTSSLIGTSLKVTADTPADVKSALEQHKPVVLLFYSPGGSDDSRVQQSLTALTPQFPAAFISQYDYRAPDTYGDLGQVLQVGYLPTTVFVDASATVTQIFSGFVDEGTLNQTLVNVTR
jgi:hypothetical protein